MRFRLIVFIIVFAMGSSAQTPRINSFRQSIPNLDSNKKTDCLNALAYEFTFHYIQSDSGLKYANLAYQCASSINYIAGKAISLNIQGDIQGLLLGHPKTLEANSREAIHLLETINDPKNLSHAYYELALGLAIQGKYDLGLQAAQHAKNIAVSANNTLAAAWALQAIGFICCKKGDYWKGFESLMSAQKTGIEHHDSLLTSLSLAFIARSFNRADDPKKALYYYHQSMRYATPYFLLWGHVEDMAVAHLHLNNYDSAFFYLQKHQHNLDSLINDVAVSKKFKPVLWEYSAEILIARKEYDRVLADIIPELDMLRKNKDVVPLMYSLLNVAKAYHAKQMYNTALQFSRELYQTAWETNNQQFLKDANFLLADLFVQVNRYDSAYAHYRMFTAIKDTIEITQYEHRTRLYLAESDAENKIGLLEKDRAIYGQQIALNKKELQKQGQEKKILITGMIILLLFFTVAIRNLILKRKNEKLVNEQAQSTLKRKALELEMQALRAQMNPHFIFNCLSAIDNLIQTSQADKATSYLASFAKLIRGVLDSSKNNVVPFHKDFETLRLYLEMEQFRCNNKFSYELTADPLLLRGDYKVPPLIIQPFIENAIHHGLLNKQTSNRQLLVSAELSEDYIIYSITDNGVGRKKASAIKNRNRPEQQSYGIDITRERIQLHNRNSISSDVLITDLIQGDEPRGTKAIIRIDSSAN